MALNKAYRAIKSLELHTYIIVKGQPVYVAFTGGTLSPRRSNGTYSTNNPDVQKALEAHPRFNKAYALISTSQIAQDPVVETIQAEQPQVAATPPMEQEIIVVKDIATVQDAKDFLAEKLEGVSKASLTNRAKVLEVAAQHGYEFPALNV